MGLWKYRFLCRHGARVGVASSGSKGICSIERHNAISHIQVLVVPYPRIALQFVRAPAGLLAPWVLSQQRCFLGVEMMRGRDRKSKPNNPAFLEHEKLMNPFSLMNYRGTAFTAKRSRHNTHHGTNNQYAIIWFRQCRLWQRNE